jgi:hypothetical protein
MTTRTIAASVVAIALAGCGGAEPATSSTPEGAQHGDSAVRRYASVVASHETEWRRTVDEIHDACADFTAPEQCAAGYLAASQQAEAFRSALPEAAGDEIPAEVSALVSDTEAAAAAYTAAFVAWDATNCANPIDFDCAMEESGVLVRALGELTRQFDAWRPHFPPDPAASP